MQPLQIFSIALDWLRSPDSPHLLRDDQFSHPQIATMTERQLADLPLPRPDLPATTVRKAELARCA